MEFFLFVLVALFGFLAFSLAGQRKALRGQNAALLAERATLQANNVALYQRSQQVEQHSQAVEQQMRQVAHENQQLARYRPIIDVEREVQRMRDEAAAVVGGANHQAAGVVAEAYSRAQAIAADALDAKRNAEAYRLEVRALKNVIEGYGDQYLIASETLLDGLAENYGYTEAGASLKAARQHIKAMIKSHQAATCDYVEQERRDAAIAFVVDAFNGKVDTVLADAKADNFGTLRQRIIDGYALVNKNGRAFRNARIFPAFCEARLEELRLAATLLELRDREREEQRRIKEQIREEEKARRDYERAQKEAAKEEDIIRKAMERAQKEIAQASDTQRAKYELQLQELGERLREAEERSKRALSMAQQTKRGHVYIISNVGSFGEDVFKIGLTRRLEPLDRVRELGDASVPFEFDVHAMIFSENAPALEHSLHRHFIASQLNKVNPRKEFFRASLGVIREEVQKLGIEASWTMAASAAQFRESQAIERAIKENPAAYHAWLNRQLVLEPLVNEESDEDTSTPLAPTPTPLHVVN